MITDPVAGSRYDQVAKRKTDGDGRSAVERAGVRGIVLAGVHAWGDCVLERVACRPLLPIADRPLLWHILKWIREGGVREASVCGNSDTTVFRRSLGTGEALDLAVEYSEDMMPRGPAGCLRDAALHTSADLIVVIDGTVVPCIDLAELLHAHTLAEATVTVVVFDAEPADGHAAGPHEPVGIYVFSRVALEKVSPTGYQDIKEGLLPSLYRGGERVVTHMVPGHSVPRVTDAASYLGANMWAVERAVLGGTPPDGYVRVGDACIVPSARVEPTARFVGPVLVGAKSVIDRDALIVGPTTIGAETTIGPAAVVSRSAVWDRCHIDSGAILDQCIITDDVHVDAELVVRETVCVPPRRSGGRLLDRLASYCRPVGRRTRSNAETGGWSRPLRG